MGTLVIALAFVSGVVSWEDAGHLPTSGGTAVRPAPIEPDTASNGPFKVEPTSFVAPTPKPRPSAGCSCDTCNCDPCGCKAKPAATAKPVPVGVVWQPDAAGYYWVRKADGSFAGDLNRVLVRSFGDPIHPAELPPRPAPVAAHAYVPTADMSAVRYYAAPVRASRCVNGRCY